MALRRKKVKGLAKPSRCYICKELNATKTLHGGYVSHYDSLSNKLCCDNCYEKVKEKERFYLNRDKEKELTEGEFQAKYV